MSNLSLSPPPNPTSECFLFSLCVWRGARSLVVASATKHRCQKRRRDDRPVEICLTKRSNIIPRLKDIHTCLESSPPLPFSLSLSLPKHSSRCGLVSMVTVGFLFQVRLSDSSDRKCATSHTHTTIKKSFRVCAWTKRVLIWLFTTSTLNMWQVCCWSHCEECVFTSSEKKKNSFSWNRNWIFYSSTKVTLIAIIHSQVLYLMGRFNAIFSPMNMSMFNHSICIRGTNKENVTTSQTTQNLYK